MSRAGAARFLNLPFASASARSLVLAANTQETFVFNSFGSMSTFCNNLFWRKGKERWLCWREECAPKLSVDHASGRLLH